MSRSSAKKIFDKIWPWALFFGGTVSLLLLFSPGWAQETAQYKIRVSVENAQVHLQPDLKSPVIKTVPLGTTLSSYQAEGAWFRVVLPPGAEGIIVIGYIATNEVDILEEKIEQPPDFWGTELRKFSGLGINLKFTVGWDMFGGGDIDQGGRGLFDQLADRLLASGYTQTTRDPKPFHAALDVNGEFLCEIDRRFGVWLEGSYLHAAPQSYFEFIEFGTATQQMISLPKISVLEFGVGISYMLPVAKWLNLGLRAGPIFGFLTYDYERSYHTMLASSQTYTQHATCRSLGALGGVEFDVFLDQGVILFAEAEGRFQTFSDLKGSEQQRTVASGGWLTSDSGAQGSLYSYEDSKYTVLTVMTEDAAAALNARKVVFHLSGVSLGGGFKFRF